MLWRCAEAFKGGVVEQNSFKQLLANLVSVNKEEATQLQALKALQRMIDASGALQDDGMVQIQKFVTRHYVPKDSDPPLEDESWDHVLFRQYLESQRENQEVNQVTRGKESIQASLFGYPKGLFASGLCDYEGESDEVDEVHHFIALPFSVFFAKEPVKTLPDPDRSHLHPSNAHFHEIMVTKPPFCKTPF